MLRFEYKYLVPAERLADLRSYLQPYVRIDPHAPEGNAPVYTVRSIYYDTPGFADYHQKVEGLRKRKKIRVRGYNQPDGDAALYVEIKRKDQGGIHKSRVKMGFQEALRDLTPPRFTNGGLGVRDDHPNGRLAKFYYYILRERLQPQLLVVYEREAYFDRFNHAIRLTFDLNLRSRPCGNLEGIYSEDNLLPSFPNHFIFEVKIYRGMPSWVKQCVARFDLTHRALSKYVNP